MPKNGHLTWKAIYQPGKVVAVGYKNGKRVLVETEETRIQLTCNADHLKDGTISVIELTVPCDDFEFRLFLCGDSFSRRNGEERRREKKKRRRRNKKERRRNESKYGNQCNKSIFHKIFINRLKMLNVLLNQMILFMKRQVQVIYMNVLLVIKYSNQKHK